MDPGLELQAVETSAPEYTSNFAAIPADTVVSDLAPVDRGREAWTFVAASFVLETVIWGFGFSYGVFQSWLTSSPSSPILGASPTAVSAVGTASLAVQYIGIMFIIPVFQRFAHRGRAVLWTALAMWCTCLVISSFASEVWQLILVQGILFGVAGGVLYLPVILWLPEWFVARRGLAGGIIFGGSGVGGALFPPLMGLLLERMGFAWTLRIWAAVNGPAAAVALYYIHPRVPVSASRDARIAPVDLSYLKHPVFFAVALTTLIQALAYFPVSLYMPTYTSSLGLPPLDGQLVLSTFNLFSVIGWIVFGYLTDRIPYHYVMIVSAGGSALAAYLLWGFARTLGLVFAFAVVFGTLAGGFAAIWPLAATDVAGPSGQPQNAGQVFSSFAVLKGVAAIIGPVLAGNLYDANEKASGEGYGGYGFGRMTLFVGSMMLATALGGVGTGLAGWMGRRRRVRG